MSMTTQVNKENSGNEQQKNTDRPVKKKGRSLGEINRDLADLIEGYKPPLLNEFADFPHKFETIRGKKTEDPKIIQIKNNTAEIVNIKYVAAELRRYVRNLCGKQKRYNLPLRGLKDVVEEWTMNYTHRKDLPRAVGFYSDSDLCLHRLPYDPIRIDRDDLAKYSPIFHEVLGRLSNSLGFCQRVGSIFDLEADRKQASWIYGPKDGGKSVLTELLKALVGPQYAVIARRNLKTPYWLASLVDKRVGMVGEAPLEFIRSDDFKNLTGDEELEVLQKYDKAYMARMNVLMFFFTNPAPELPNDDALKERIIASYLDKVPSNRKKGFKDTCRSIAKEAPYIAGYCISEYEKLSAGEPMTCDYAEIQDGVDKFESRYLQFFDEWLKPGGQISSNCLYNLMKNFGFLSGPDQKACKEAIQSRYHYTEKYEYVPSGRQWIIRGISKKFTGYS